MTIEPPPALANIPAVPAPQDPPTLQDVTNAIDYVEDIKVDRKFNPACPTKADLAIAYTYRSTVISARSGEAVAPPWFNEVMRSVLRPLEEKIDEVKADLNHVKVGLRETVRTMNTLYNQQCRDGRLAPYKVIQFLDGTSPDDHDLPALHTAQDIRDLNHLDVRKYMRGYGLSLHSEDHRQAIAIAIGCSEYQ